MRDVDCDFESVVVTRKNKKKQKDGSSSSSSSRPPTRLLAGASDSPQAYVIPQYALRSTYELIPRDHDLGKHGDTAVGEIKALEALVANDGDHHHQGAVVSRIMWDRAVRGLLPTIDGAKLNATYEIDDAISLPKFDHCQFDALLSNADKVAPFYHALHAMTMTDPAQATVMKLEGIRQRWSMPRQEGYDIVRSALSGLYGIGTGSGGSPLGRRAQNFVPGRSSSGVAARAFSTNTTTTSTGTTRPFSSSSSSPRTMPTTVALAPGSRVGVIGCGVAGLQVIRSMRARDDVRWAGCGDKTTTICPASR